MKKGLRQSVVRQLQTSDPEICSCLVGHKTKPKSLPIAVRPFLKNAHQFKFQMDVLEEEDSDLSDNQNSDVETSSVASNSEVEE